MALCKSCDKLINLHTWRNYIMINYQCNFCDMSCIGLKFETELENVKGDC